LTSISNLKFLQEEISPPKKIKKEEKINPVSGFETQKKQSVALLEINIKLRPDEIYKKKVTKSTFV